jgi:hypothetical protein
MVLSRSCRRVARVLTGAALAAAAFAGVLLASRSAHAQGVYVYRPYGPYRPAPPAPAYGYGYGYNYGYAPARPVYISEREPPYALQIGFDLEGAVPVGVNVPGTGNDLKGGGGFKIRVGEQMRFPGIRFTPEAAYAYDHLWANDDNNNQFGWDMNRIVGGARLSFGQILVPVVYGHIGYGWVQRGVGWDQLITGGNGGLTYDIGGALDIRIVPHFGVGAHIEYDAIDVPFQPQWVSLGLHADLIFW